MEERFSYLRQQFKSALENVKDLKDVEDLKVHYLRKKGPIQDLMQSLRECTAEERPHLGKKINSLKEELSHLCEEAITGFRSLELNLRLAQEKVDVTLPGRSPFLGRKHPITLMLDEINDILR